MIVSNIIHRVFRVQFDGQQGTMFTIDVEGKQYLVTAKHILEKANAKFKVEIFHNGSWRELDVELTGHSADTDLSVMAATTILTEKSLAAEPSAADIIYSQEVFFLGFPYGLFGEFEPVNHGFPLPFVKRAILSMMDTKKNKVMYLDGINNLGFSGGPVAFKVNATAEWRIAGVISGYLTTTEIVAHNSTDIGLRYAANTGLIKASPIKEAIDLISANPNGRSHPS